MARFLTSNLTRSWKKVLLLVCVIIMEVVIILKWSVNYCGMSGIRIYYCHNSETCCARNHLGVYQCCNEVDESPYGPVISSEIKLGNSVMKMNRIFLRTLVFAYVLLFFIMLAVLGFLMYSFNNVHRKKERHILRTGHLKNAEL